MNTDLFSSVEIRWKSRVDDGETPLEVSFHLRGGLADYLADTMGGALTYAERPFAGKVSFESRFNLPV